MTDTEPTTHIGKVDPGDGPGVYYTAKWTDGVGGRLDDRFAAFRDVGYRCYRWDQPGHYVHGSPEQTASIKSFIDSGECKAFVFECDSSAEHYPHGATNFIMGYVAMGTDIPVHYVGKEESVTFKNLIGATLKQQGRLHFHATCADAVKALAKEAAM